MRKKYETWQEINQLCRPTFIVCFMEQRVDGFEQSVLLCKIGHANRLFHLVFRYLKIR